LIRLYERDLDQKPLAFQMACRAFAENPLCEDLRSRVIVLAEQTGSHGELAGLYQEILDQLSDDELRSELAQDLARIYEQKLDQPARAAALWRDLLANDPESTTALAALERIYRLQEDFVSLAWVLKQRIKRARDSEQKKDLLYDLAFLQEEHLGEIEGAMQAYVDILAEDPLDVSAMKLLNRLCMTSGNFTYLLNRNRDNMQ
jgi:tetratricopeptide (TPR) repeat protein